MVGTRGTIVDSIKKNTFNEFAMIDNYHFNPLNYLSKISSTIFKSQ